MNTIFGFRKKFASISFLVIILFILGTAILARQNYLQDFDRIILQNTTSLTIVKNAATADFANRLRDTLFIRDLFELTYAREDIKNPLDLIAYNFSGFSRQKKFYDQIRFLDITGQEKVRVNYNYSNPIIVPEDNLQNKKGRYYFDNTIILDRDNILVSPLDLNIEQNIIEQPSSVTTNIDEGIWRKSSNGYVKPMIRFSTPTQDKDGKINGMVILNFFGQYFLKSIDVLATQPNYPVFLVNNNGYMLKSPDEHQEWGFMYNNLKDETFQKYFPNAWTQLTQQSSGNFITSEGLFIFDTITISSDKATDLKLITFLDIATLNALKYKHIMQVVLFDGVSLILFIIALYVYRKLKLGKQIVEEENVGIKATLQAKNEELSLTKSKLEEALKKQMSYTKELEGSFKETKQKSDELEKMNAIMVDRELKMVTLKKEIANLEKELKKKTK